MNFFRLQGKGHNLEDMQNYETLVDVDPETGEDIREKGVCATLGPDDGFGGAHCLLDSPEHEVVVFKGRIVQEIYDGYVVEPIEEIARFSAPEWAAKIKDESAWDYEDWL